MVEKALVVRKLQDLANVVFGPFTINLGERQQEMTAEKVHLENLGVALMQLCIVRKSQVPFLLDVENIQELGPLLKQ